MSGEKNKRPLIKKGAPGIVLGTGAFGEQPKSPFTKDLNKNYFNIPGLPQVNLSPIPRWTPPSTARVAQGGGSQRGGTPSGPPARATATPATTPATGASGDNETRGTQGAYDTRGTSGSYESRGSSGGYEQRGSTGDNWKRGPRLAPNVRPWLDAANYGLEKWRINKIWKDQMARKNMYYETPQLSVRPVQDLTPEMLAKMENDVAGLKSGAGSSDPGLTAIQKGMNSDQRRKLHEAHLVQRSDNLTKERARWDTQMRDNQKAVADTSAKNLDKAQEFADWKLSATNAKDEAQKVLDQSFLANLGFNLDTAAEFNLQRDAMNRQIQRQKIEDRMALAALQPEGRRQGAVDDLTKTIAEYEEEQLPDYNTARRQWRITPSQKYWEYNQGLKRKKQLAT